MSISSSPFLSKVCCQFLSLSSQGDIGQKGLPGPPGPPGYGSQGIKVSESDFTGIISQVSRAMRRRCGFITKHRFSESVTVKMHPGFRDSIQKCGNGTSAVFLSTLSRTHIAWWSSGWFSGLRIFGISPNRMLSISLEALSPASAEGSLYSPRGRTRGRWGIRVGQWWGRKAQGVARGVDW